jgi:hypothetical protein
MKLCELPGCGRPYAARGLCKYHGRRIERNLPIDAEHGLGTLGRKICQADKCEDFVSGHGLCKFHLGRKNKGIPLHQRRKQKYAEDAICAADGCSKKPEANDLCRFHYGRSLKAIDLNQPMPVRRIVSFIPTLEELDSLCWSKNAHGYMAAKANKKIILQHRAIWEAHNGRKLQRFENIHHKNGIRHDNRIENLELWTKTQPCGQRPEDLVSWVIDYYRELVEARLALF